VEAILSWAKILTAYYYGYIGWKKSAGGLESGEKLLWGAMMMETVER